MGLFNKSSKFYPLTLDSGSSMNIRLDSLLPQEFIFQEFVALEEKLLELQI